ncbi:MAG: hypothetical protein P8L18_11875 [Verrucomicrobiota bacterium]|nr:hypothetical protein [Verrucomicrobiota bacterium]
MWKTESQQISGLYIRNGKIFYSDEGAGIVNGFDMEKKSITNFCQEGIEGYGKSRRPGEVLATNDLLIVNDRDNYLIQFFDIKGEFLYQIGGKGSGICCFDLVEGIQLEGDVLLIADMNNDRILRYSLINLEMEVTHRRRYIPGLLCRPVSGCLVGDKIFVADRSNAVIPIIDPLKGFQGVFPMKKPRVDLGSPTGLVAISSRNLLFVLFRGNDYGRGTLCLFDLHTGNCISYDRERIADAQGMTYGNQQVVVCDGKGKSGFIYSESLKLIKRLDFLKDSQNSRFLCRMPSYAFGKFYFPDYHSNQVLVYDMEWNLLQVLLVNLSQYGIKHIRKVFPFSNGFVLLGGKKPWGVEVDTEWNLKKISRLPLMFFKNTFSSPSDMIWLEEKKVIVFDKEQDRLVKLTDETMDLVGNVSAGSAG